MPSLLLNLVVRICLFNVSNSDKITFENVTVRSYFYKGALETQATSVNLKKMIPDEEPVRVDITGGVPILYEKSVFDIPNLNSLDLADVGLEEIKPGAFGNLPLLDTLFLNRNNLTLIKSGTFTDLNVSYLDLSSNSIFLLQPRAFKNFKAGHVSLDKNKLTEISSGVFENVTLRSLSLGDNHLYIIAPKALSAIGLTTLSLFGNKLEEIDPEVFDMQE
ncbi:hypothetical protein Zmor_015957, partial [Zophobas morio]